VRRDSNGSVEVPDDESFTPTGDSDRKRDVGPS
jgi:hypothetical protein